MNLIQGMDDRERRDEDEGRRGRRERERERERGRSALGESAMEAVMFGAFALLTA